MLSRVSLRTCFSAIFLLFFFSGINAQSIYIDLEMRVAPDLKIPVDHLKKDLYAGMEKGFSDRGILVVKQQSRSDFTLEGTIESKHFIKSSSSYSVLFKAKHLKISATPYKGLIPSLAYHPFTGRDRTGGVSPAQDLDDAVDLALEDLLYMMKQYGIFAFQNHPVFANVAKIDKKDLEKIKTRKELDQMADRIIKELKEAIAAAVKARPPIISQPTVPIKDNAPELNRILKEIEGLKKQKKSIAALKRMIQKKLDTLDEIAYVNIASIIIETNPVNAKFRSTFEAVIMPDKPCPECNETKINATNLGRMAIEADFNKFSQEQRYRIPFRMKGKMLQDSSGQWKILVSKSDYKKIFDIDQNGRLPKGTIIKSITDKTDLYPRILVKIGK
jgi:hypothetical protein